MEAVKRLDRTLVKHGAIIDLYDDTVKTQAGNIVHYDFIGHKGAAAVVPVCADGRLLMVRQYRNAVDRFTLEIPAGGKNGADELPYTCAMRELEEETGYKTDKLEHLIDIYTTVAFCNEKISVYVAENLVPSKQNLDEDEFIDVEAVSIEKLTDMILDGTIMDAKTVSAILAYKEKYIK